MGKLRTLGLCMGLLLVPATGLSHEKRTDRCGCHQQYGLRHCHPNKKTSRCEAPVRAAAPARPPARRGAKM